MPRESLKDKKARTERLIEILKGEYPDARTALTHRTVHQLMVATILSAQCTDERVNMVTPALFKRYKTVRDFAEADIDELSEIIRSTGFFNSKAKNIIKSAQQLIAHHNGRVPKSLDELTKLAGVGRKTASVVLGAGYGLAEGIVVDTHVGRISRLLKLTGHKDPEKVERDLMKLVPTDDWIIFSHLLILHGRAICKARRPDCPNCPINDLCPSSTV